MNAKIIRGASATQNAYMLSAQGPSIIDRIRAIVTPYSLREKVHAAMCLIICQLVTLLSLVKF